MHGMCAKVCMYTELRAREHVHRGVCTRVAGDVSARRYMCVLLRTKGCAHVWQV